MTGNREVWDGAYERRGQLWGGAPPSLPGLPDHARVLELGCGNGKMFPALQKEGRKVVGLDFSRSAVVAARSLPAGPRPCDIVLADARSLPFIRSSFDAVIARHIIGHMDRDGRKQIARGILQVLRPGGMLHFSAFSREDFRYGHGTPPEEGTFIRGNGISTHYFTGDETIALFSGLSCTSLDKPQWTLRIRGKDHTRSEIHAIFTRDLA